MLTWRHWFFFFFCVYTHICSAFNFIQFVQWKWAALRAAQPPRNVCSTAETVCWQSAHLPKHVLKIERAGRLCTAKINSPEWRTVVFWLDLMGSGALDILTAHCIVFAFMETLWHVWGVESELPVKTRDWESQRGGPVTGDSAKLNVLSYFFHDSGCLEFFNPGVILKYRPNPFPVNQMNAVRRGLEAVLAWIRTWLKCSLTILWRALLATNTWRASPGTRGPCKAEEWRTNEALRHYHHGNAAESRVTVQTTTQIFHVSNRFAC